MTPKNSEVDRYDNVVHAQLARPRELRGDAPDVLRLYAWGAACVAGLLRKNVSVANETAAAAAIAATPHHRPEILSSQPIARSSEKRPGPIAASATTATRYVSSSSEPAMNARFSVTEKIAFSITTAIIPAASGVASPSASSVPPPASVSPAITAIGTPQR